MARLTAALIAASTTLIFIFILTSGRPNGPIVIPSIDPQWLPGAAFRPSSNCHFQVRETHYCQMSDAVFIATDGNVILQSKFHIEDAKIPVGNAVIAWGNPVGTQHANTDTNFYVWNDVFIATKGSKALDPFSVVRYIGYGKFDGNLTPWRGFRSNP